MPAASDRGVSLGAATYLSAELNEEVVAPTDMYLGRSWTKEESVRILSSYGVKFKDLNSPMEYLSDCLENGQVIGFFEYRAEFGPRSLGARSILASPRVSGIRDKINSSIKYREQFRPFAPAILDTELEFFSPKADFSSMTITSKIPEGLRTPISEAVHIDGTSRIQIVKNDNKAIGKLLKVLKQSGSHPSLINTSFNLKGEPIVYTPADAMRTFFSSGLDTCYINGLIVEKS